MKAWTSKQDAWKNNPCSVLTHAELGHKAVVAKHLAGRVFSEQREKNLGQIYLFLLPLQMTTNLCFFSGPLNLISSDLSELITFSLIISQGRE